jgi:hypothetical protein
MTTVGGDGVYGTGVGDDGGDGTCVRSTISGQGDSGGVLG